MAVANTDEGYQSDLIPLRINIGDQGGLALRANDQIDWHITDEEDAIDGAKSGRYYAAVVIPKSFSRDMLTFYTGDAGHAISSTTPTRRRAPSRRRSPIREPTRCPIR